MRPPVGVAALASGSAALSLSLAAPAQQPPEAAETAVAHAPSPGSFDARAAEFWAWFASRAGEMHRRMFEPWMVEQVETIGERVDAAVPGLAWTFGPGDAEAQHAWIASPEGDLDHALLAQRLVAAAPALEGWVFRSSKPPGEIQGQVIQVGSSSLAAEDIRILATVDAPQRVVDVVVHHPDFGDAPQALREQIAFLFLDHALGEAGTEA